MKRKLLIDTDTASDDAVALVMALRSPKVEVKAITVVAGNVAVDQGVRNALYTVELCGAEVPVHRGADRPMMRRAVTADFIHGSDGMGDMDYPAPELCAETKPAVDAIVDVIDSHPGIEMVTLGPLTNLAEAVLRAPRIAGKVSRCVVMGGVSCLPGNVTPVAEYNIWCDPEAARIVLHSGLTIELVGWELSRFEAGIDAADRERIDALGTPLARFALDSNRTVLAANLGLLTEPTLDLPDPVAMAVTLEPEICLESELRHVEVETGSDLTRGMIVIDSLGVGASDRNLEVWGPLVERGPNATVCRRIDVPRFKRLLLQSLA